MKPNYRSDKVNQLVQVALAKLIQQEIQDPRLRLLTITEVSVSRDLRYAKIYISMPDNDAIKDALKALKKAAKFLRFHLAKEIDLRVMPELVFVQDNSIQTGQRISKLLQNDNE